MKVSPTNRKACLFTFCLNISFIVKFWLDILVDYYHQCLYFQICEVGGLVTIAKFGYRLERKVEKFRNPATRLATC
jgi:hypothetical protein